MNQFQIIGHLGQDARENLVSGKKVINFSVAVNDSYKDQQGNKVERTIWVECSWWRDMSAQYLKRGAKVFVQGVCRIKEYKDRNGEKQSILSLQVNSAEIVQFADDKNKPQVPYSAPIQTNAPAQSTPDFKTNQEALDSLLKDSSEPIIGEEGVPF